MKQRGCDYTGLPSDNAMAPLPAGRSAAEAASRAAVSDHPGDASASASIKGRGDSNEAQQQGGGPPAGSDAGVAHHVLQPEERNLRKGAKYRDSKARRRLFPDSP